MYGYQFCGIILAARHNPNNEVEGRLALEI